MYRLLSYVIDENTPMYGGRSGFVSKKQSSIKNGDTANTSIWQFPNHLGTHIDFPRHFYENGQTLKDFGLDFWMYNENDIQLLELDLPENELLIKPKHVKEKEYNKDAKIVLLKTGAAEYRNNEKYWKYNPGLSCEISDWVREKFKKIRILGIDSISISSWQHRNVGRQVHKKMLNPKKPILLVEDMNLSKVNKDTVFKIIYVAPLIISKSDGAPCTILAEVKKQ